jgi:hypothetical protein
MKKPTQTFPLLIDQSCYLLSSCLSLYQEAASSSLLFVRSAEKKARYELFERTGSSESAGDSYSHFAGSYIALGRLPTPRPGLYDDGSN